MIDNQKMSIILPGRIVSFDAATQTATVQISAETVFSDAGQLSQAKTRAPLEGVPVHTLCGGGWSITNPIEEGDTCTLFFSQIGYDHWLYEDKDTAGQLANVPKPWLKRQFSDDDGFALVGFNTIPRAIENFTQDGSQWRNKDATQSIHLKRDGSIIITSPVSCTIDTPETYVTGNMTVDGIIKGLMDIRAGANLTAAGGLAAGVPLARSLAVAAVGGITGTAMNLTGDATIGGISYLGHVHQENDIGGDTGAPK